MKRVSKAKNRARKVPRVALSRIVMLVTLLAFSIQGYLTQTHIHWAMERQASLSQSQDHRTANGAPTDRKDGYPANEDPANCPLCQELIHAGQFVTPAAAALGLPFFSISVIEVAVPTAMLVQAVTHIWRGRAPPVG